MSVLPNHLLAGVGQTASAFCLRFQLDPKNTGITPLANVIGVDGSNIVTETITRVMIDVSEMPVYTMQVQGVGIVALHHRSSILGPFGYISPFDNTLFSATRIMVISEGKLEERTISNVKRTTAVAQSISLRTTHHNIAVRPNPDTADYIILATD